MVKGEWVGEDGAKFNKRKKKKMEKEKQEKEKLA